MKGGKSWLKEKKTMLKNITNIDIEKANKIDKNKEKKDIKSQKESN